MDDFKRFTGKPQWFYDRFDKLARQLREAGRVTSGRNRTSLGRGKRKPPEAGVPVPAVPPKGPLPLQGGAEAPLEFRED